MRKSDDATIDKDGNVKSFEEQIEKLTKDKITEYLFDTQKQPGTSEEVSPRKTHECVTYLMLQAVFFQAL